MVDRHRLIHAVFIIALPLIVAGFGLSVAAAIALVILILLWRWAISLAGLFAPVKGPGVVLDTISASHFVEKVRWSLDRLGIDYIERAGGGLIGVVFTGRTVPRLRFSSGLVQSSIGNSPEILRYLWGAYVGTHGERASFLEPTAERLELEKRLDRYAGNLQVWLYYHMLPNRELTLHLWGVDSPLVPAWQKPLVTVMFPLFALFIRRAFRISDEHYAKATHHIEDLLADVDMRLADGRRSILGGADIDFVDITFASFSGLWLQPDGYGGGKADDCLIPRTTAPTSMRADIERWIEDYPKATEFVTRLYAEERLKGTSDADDGLN